jgi:hypothetical protein
MNRTLLASGLLLLLGVPLLLFSGCLRTATRAAPQPPESAAVTAKAPGPVAGNGGRAAAPSVSSGGVIARAVPTPLISQGGAKFTAKTEMMTIGGTPVYWPEFYFWLRFIEKHYRRFHRIDKISDWRAQQNGMALKAFFLSSAVGYACQERAIEAKARELGLALTSADEAEIAEVKKRHGRIYGRTEYLRMIRREYVSEEVFAYLTRMDHLGKRLYTHLYGENGERCPEENDAACQGLFRSQVEAWCADLEIAYTEAYHRIDPELLFK